jgi:hypothetical protein
MTQNFLRLAADKMSPLQKLIIANGLWFLNKQYKNFLRQTLFKVMTSGSAGGLVLAL